MEDSPHFAIRKRQAKEEFRKKRTNNEARLAIKLPGLFALRGKFCENSITSVLEFKYFQGESYKEVGLGQDLP